MRPCSSPATNHCAASQPINAARRLPLLAFLLAIIIGFVAGTVAKFIMPGRDPGGFIVTILLGIAGSLVATWLGRQIGWYQSDQGARFIGSVVGAVVILAVYRFVVRNRGNRG